MGTHFLRQLQKYGETSFLFSHFTSDDDTSENDDFADFLFTNEVTQVNAIDESSNSSTAEYTQLVSVSVTNKHK